MNIHLSEEQQVGYIHQTLSDAQREAIDQHLTQCSACRVQLADHELMQLYIHNNLQADMRNIQPDAHVRFDGITHQLIRQKRNLTSLNRLRQTLSGVTGFVTLAVLVIVMVAVINSTLQPAGSLGQPDRFEPNDDFDTATPIELNTRYLNLNFVPHGRDDPFSPDEDYFRILVEPGMTITCETFNLSRNADTVMILFDGDHDGLAGHDDISLASATRNLGSRVTYSVRSEGPLYIYIGQPFTIGIDEADQYTYSLECSVEP